MAEVNRAGVSIEADAPMRRMLWCGVVFALGTLMAALNFLPPVAIEYRIRSEVLVSDSRFAQIEAAIQSGKSHLNGEPRLLQVAVLDDSAISSSTIAVAEDLLLVEVITQWAGSYSEEQLQQWLEETTRRNLPNAADPTLERQRRLAHWELQTLQNYLQRHEFLASGSQPSGSGATSSFAFANTRSGVAVPAQLASQTNSGNDLLQDEESAALVAGIALAEQKVETVEKAWLEQLEKTAGVLEFAQRPELQPESSTIPFWMAASVLLVGLSAGATAGWTQRRLESADIHDAKNISRQLAQSGIPIAGQLRFDSAATSPWDWGDKARQTLQNLARGLGRNMTRYAEWTLWFWVCIIAARFVLEPMWRAVLVESPLAALGRLLAGMP